MMIEQMENSILTQLQDKITGVEIASLNVAPESYQLLHAVGAILVRYQGSDFDTSNYELGAAPADQLDQLPENRALQFEVRLYFRDLKSNQGLYVYLNQVLQALTGFRPDPAGELLPVKDIFESEVNGLWQYFILFKSKYP